MKDIIMEMSSVLFIILFSFLAFIFVIFLISRFIKKKNFDFEPEISIIVPVFNEEKNIGECLDAILNSDYPEKKMEVIVIDDGSTDKTKDILKRYEKVNVLEQSHLGKAEALNLGVSKARYDFVLTIDADTIIDKSCIKEIVRPLADENIGATTGNSKVKNNNSIMGIFQNIEYHYNNLIRHCFSTVFNNGIWFFGALAAYRKSLLNDVGSFKKDTLTEDMDMALEIKRQYFHV